MGYFGGFGAGKGWQSYYFLITPDELHAQLAALELSLVITNCRVPVTYFSTPIEEYREQYAAYFRAVSGEGDGVDWHVTSPMYISLTRPSVHIGFEVITRHPEYKLVEPSEPLINLSPFPLYYDNERQQISLVHGGMESWSFGLRMDYPKVVSYSSEHHECLHNTSSYMNAELFAQLKGGIDCITTNATILSPAKRHRTKVRISEAVLSQVYRSRPLVEQRLCLVNA